MKGKDDNWDYDQWQGRSRKQVEGTYIIMSVALITLALAVVVGLLFS